MPKMDGLEALSRDPGPGSVRTRRDRLLDRPTRRRRSEALSLGAVNLIRKPFDHAEIQFVLDRIYRALEQESDIRDVLDLVDRRTTHLNFSSEVGVLSKVVAYLGRELQHGYPGFDIPITEIKLALYEALANAFEHGNLEISFEEKSKVLDGGRRHRGADGETPGRPRVGQPAHPVQADYGPGRVRYRVRDEGKGFDPAAQTRKPLADATALHGRGITLIRHYMDDVSWNETGNEVRLDKYLALKHGSAE